MSLRFHPGGPFLSYCRIDNQIYLGNTGRLLNTINCSCIAAAARPVDRISNTKPVAIASPCNHIQYLLLSPHIVFKTITSEIATTSVSAQLSSQRGCFVPLHLGLPVSSVNFLFAIALRLRIATRFADLISALAALRRSKGCSSAVPKGVSVAIFCQSRRWYESAPLSSTRRCTLLTASTSEDL